MVRTQSMSTLLVLFLGLVTFATHAQTGLSEYQEINFRFKEGYFFDSTGARKQGYIRHILHNHNVSRHADNYIHFKLNQDSLDYRLTTNDISGFVCDQDSFVVIKQFKFHGWQNYQEDFCRVVIPEGKVRMLEHYTLSTVFGDHGAEYKIDTGYVLLVQGLEKPHCVHFDYFKKDLTTLFKIDKALCERINQDAYKPKDVALIVGEFNSWWEENH